MLTPMFSHMTSIIRNGAMHNKENTLHTRAAGLQSGSLNTSIFWLDMGGRADSFKTSALKQNIFVPRDIIPKKGSEDASVFTLKYTQPSECR